MKTIHHTLFFLLFFSIQSGRCQTLALDSSFGSNGLVNGNYKNSASTEGLALSPDGKILSAGLGSFLFNRYNNDGTIDNSFADNGQAFYNISNDVVYGLSVKLQANGKILGVAGITGSGFAPDTIATMLLNNDGTIDSTFPIGACSRLLLKENTGYTWQQQADDKLLFAFRDFVTEDLLLTRFNDNRQIDSSFGIDGSINCTSFAQINCIKIQPDGKILLTGNLPDSAIGLMRINVNGTVDSFFGLNGLTRTKATDGGTDQGLSAIIQPDDKILIAGAHLEPTSQASDYDFSLFRYKPDGTPDSSFGNNGMVITPNLQRADYITGISIESNGKIIVVGNSIDNWSKIQIARYSADGHLDVSVGNNGLFFYEVGGPVYAFQSILQPDGKLLIGGNFFPGDPNSFLMLRFKTDVFTAIESFSASETLSVFPNPAQDILNLAYPQQSVQLKIYSVTGKLERSINSFNERTLNISELASGVYSIELFDGISKVQCRYIKW